MLHYLCKLLNNKKAYYILFGLNILVGVVIFNISSKVQFPDSTGYWLMGESILNGKFSSWYFLPKYYPETLRTPGYPIFLAFCQLISNSPFFVKVIQLLIYFISIHLCTLIIRKLTSNLVGINLFLLLLIPNIQIVYYTGYISAEILSVFFITLTMYLMFSRKTLFTALLLAFTCYCSFIVRPAFLIFPFLLSVYFIFQDKKNSRFSLLFISMYLILLIPFGLWNKFNHGVFKVTSLEGGAGVAHLGFWQLKLMDGYTETYYWGNHTSYDYTKPNFYTKEEQLQNTKDLEKEGNNLLRDIAVYESKEDSIYLVSMKNNSLGILPLRNSKYTIAREKRLWQLAKENIIAEPLFYIKSRVYHFIRFYVSGINYMDFKKSNSLTQKAKTLYPFFITLIFIFGGLIFISINAIFKKNHFPNIFAFILLLWYYGGVHLPFVIQARYTIPIHLLLLAILSVMVIKKINSADLLIQRRVETNDK